MIKIRGITIDAELEKFLREKKVYTSFCNNVNNIGGFKDSEKFVLPNIAEAFDWCGTPEGIVFWGELDDKFYNK